MDAERRSDLIKERVARLAVEKAKVDALLAIASGLESIAEALENINIGNQKVIGGALDNIAEATTIASAAKSRRRK